MNHRYFLGTFATIVVFCCFETGFRKGCAAQTSSDVKPNSIVRGTVSDGKDSLANAKLTFYDSLHRLSSRSDAQGNFQFEVEPSGEFMLIAEKNGFRISGLIFDSSKESCDIILQSVAATIPVQQQIRTREIPLTKEKRLELAEKLLKPFRTRLEIEPTNSVLRIWTLEPLAAIDPENALIFVEDHPGHSQMDAMSIAKIARQYIDNDPQTAFDIIATVNEPMGRCGALTELYRKADTQNKTIVKQILAATIVEAKSIKDPAYRLAVLGMLAEYYQIEAADSPELNRNAQSIIDQYLEEAKQLPDDGFASFAKSQFAVSVSRENLDDALRMIENLASPAEWNRHLLHMAFHLGSVDPENATKLLDKLKPARENSIGPFDACGRVAQQIAGINPSKALDFVKTTELFSSEASRAWALSGIAAQIAEQDPALAVQTIEDAFKILDSVAARSTTSPYFDGCVTGLAILPVIETIDPNLVETFFWRAIKLAPVRQKWTGVYGGADSFFIQIAQCASRYDLSVAQFFLSKRRGPILNEQHKYFYIICATSPDQLESELIELDESSIGNDMKAFCRSKVVNFLCCKDEEFWNRTTEIMFLRPFKRLYETGD